MKKPSLNIVLGVLIGAGVAGWVAVELAGRSRLWFGLAIGTVGGWLIAKTEQWVLRDRSGTK